MKPNNRMSARLGLVASLLAGGAALGASGALALGASDGMAQAIVAPQIAPLIARGGAHSLADMVQAVGPSVVQISVRKHVDGQQTEFSSNGDGDEAGGNGGMEDQLRRFFGGQGGGGAPQGQAPHEEGALGSGFIIDRSGIILTNNHVVEGASQVTVQTSDGHEYRGTVLGTDPKTDVAALGLLLGWWYSRRGLTFVGVASDAGDRFLAGNLAERLPVSVRGDEYDRLAETINRTFAEVERLVGSQRAATDGMAHDLKTPLTRIRARLELAELQQAPPKVLQRAVEETRHDLDGLLQLIDDMLSLASAEATPTTGFVPVALHAIVDEALELYLPLAEDKAVHLEVAISQASVVGSRSLLARLVANLLDNAIKYTPAGGCVRVALVSEDQNATLIVADDGPGIPPDRHEEVLRRFGRLDASRTAPGSGLGLSIVEAVAHLHEATLRLIDNSPGLQVKVSFPLTKRAPAPE